MTTLNDEEKRLLNELIKLMPFMGDFTISGLHDLILAQQFKTTTTQGYEDYRKKKHEYHYSTIYQNITQYLVENGFVTYANGRDWAAGIKLTEDKGHELYNCQNLQYYEGKKLREKHAAENKELQEDEYKQTQNDLNLITIRVQQEQAKLIQSQVETNKISKSTNVLIALFTSFAGLWYLRSFLNDIIPEMKCYYNKNVLVVVLTFFLFSIAAYAAHLWLKTKEKPSKIEPES